MAAELFSPPAKALDANAAPYAGAKWKFYQTGTTTPQSVYADASLSTSLGSTVTADSSGKFAPIYFNSALSYRGICENADGSVTLHDIDPINSEVWQDTLADLASTASSKGAGLTGFSQSATYDASTAGKKIQQTISVEDHPYSGDVAATITAAAGRDIVLTTNYTVTSITNTRGSRFTGPGKLLVTHLGGQFQLNSYADRYPLFVGKEYLYRLFLRIKNGGTLTGFIYGDSTVATAANGGGYAGSVGEPQTLMPRMLSRKGVRNTISFTNRGVGGTKVSDMSATGDIGLATDIFFIKYGINDAADGLSGFATNLRSKLNGIRTFSGYGTVDNLSIVLIGPNATFDPQHGRSSSWYEDLRGIYEAAARDYQCAYFDTYAYMREVSWAAAAAGGEMMDNPYSNGQGVHPKEVMQSLIYGKLVDEMISFSDLSIWDNNALNALTLQNSWTNYGSSFGNAAYSMDRDGNVSLHGMIAPGTLTSGTTLSTLPSGFRPYSHWTFCAPISGGAQANIRVLTTGEIQLHDTIGAVSWLSLSGVEFPTR